MVPFWQGALAKSKHHKCEKKGGCFLVKNLIGIKHSRNNLARNIRNIFLPLRCEIFVDEKRNQVETDEHVFYNMQIKPSVSKSQFEVEGSVIFFISSASSLSRMSFLHFLTSTSASFLFDGWRSIFARTCSFSALYC